MIRLDPQSRHNSGTEATLALPLKPVKDTWHLQVIQVSFKHPIDQEVNYIHVHRCTVAGQFTQTFSLP